MAKQMAIEKDGTIIEILPNGRFRVELDNGHLLIAYVSGKMKNFKINIVRSDRVKVAISPYDLTIGRITFRYKPEKTKIN